MLMALLLQGLPQPTERVCQDGIRSGIRPIAVWVGTVPVHLDAKRFGAFIALKMRMPDILS